jgi:small subunit ribosomal protein S2
MDQYIFDTRKKISIINLELTQEHLSAAASKVEDICSRGNKILFVGTKRSAGKVIKEEASQLGLPYVGKRWLGGTLTNWKTIRGSVRRLIDIEEMISSGRIEKLIKKEAVEIQKEHSKLQASVGGIKDMKGLPDAIFVIDVKYEKIAVLEAKKMGIPVIALVDTLCQFKNLFCRNVCCHLLLVGGILLLAILCRFCHLLIKCLDSI